MIVFRSYTAKRQIDRLEKVPLRSAHTLEQETSNMPVWTVLHLWHETLVSRAFVDTS